MRWRTWAWIIGGALIGLPIVAVLAVLTTAWLSLPQTSGEVTVDGLNGPVDVVRTEHGVPVITAETAEDGYFALGWVHAQDRLFQMDMTRRLASGRLAEVIGAEALPTDKFMRTLGLARAAETSLPALLPETVSALEAYSAGVNAFLSQRTGPLPPEFLILRFEPDLWQPIDSLLWARLMGLRLSGNWREEALRARLLSFLSEEQVADLWPTPMPEAPTTLKSLSDNRASSQPDMTGTLTALMEAWPPEIAPTLASNAWAVHGNRTASGLPLLASDPHLGFGAPILWYLAEIRTPEGTLRGATAPGTPFHIIGANDHIAWGLTTTHSDTMDLFVETTAEDDTAYLTPEGVEPFTSIEEVIGVRDADSITLVVRETRHGPVVSDLLSVPLPEQSVLALAAAPLAPADRTADGARLLNRAQTWQEALEALNHYHSPQQNVLVADGSGTIGYFAPARVPVRKAGQGLTPQPGATGEFDWTGWLPYDVLPRTANPPSGWLANANNRPVPLDYQHLLSVHWPPPYRAMRLETLLTDADQATPESMRAMQMDNVSVAAQRLVPRLSANASPESQAGQDALISLKEWDGIVTADRAEPLFFAAWLLELNRRIFSDDLKEAYSAWGGFQPEVLEKVFSGTSSHDWCDDIRTPDQETCTEQAGSALDDAVDTLREQLGDEVNWTWGAVHVARFEHQVFGQVPILRDLVAIEVETDGGDFTINRGGVADRRVGGSLADRLAHVHGAGLRAVFDLAEPAASRFVIATGQSGHPLSRHWDDMLDDWRSGRLLPIGPSLDDAPKLILRPSASPAD